MVVVLLNWCERKKSSGEKETLALEENLEILY